MDFDRDGQILPVTDIQGDSSWVPTTPVKPSLTTPKPICANRLENEAVDADWLETQVVSQGNHEVDGKKLEIESSPGRFPDETRGQNVSTAFCQSTDSVNISRDFNSWEAAKSQLHGANAAIYNELSMNDADTWNNVSFANLLALAHAAAARTGCNATTGSLTPIVDSQFEGRHLPAYSSLPNQEFLNATKFWTSCNQAPDISGYGSSIASRLSLDLTLSGPRTVSEVALRESIESQFASITPDQGTRVSKEQVSNVPETRDVMEKGLSVRNVELEELQKDENHAPDKGGSQGCDLNMTPQKKSRKKHRPKVVIEGQPKRTPKPRTPKPAAPEGTVPGKRKYVRRNGGSKIAAIPTEYGNDKTTSIAKPSDSEVTLVGKRKYVRRKGVQNFDTPEGTVPAKRKYVRRKGGSKIEATPTEYGNDRTASTAKPPGPEVTPVGKRKYVRRKGVQNPASTPLEEGISKSDEAIDWHTKSSCRRSLNFEFESQERDDSSSYGSSSNSKSERLAQSIRAQDHSSLKKQLQHAMDSETGNTELGTGYAFTCSTNQALEKYMSIFKRQAPGPSISLKNHLAYDKSTGGQQNECMTGKHQVAFSDATPNKQVNVVQMMMSVDAQCLRKSPSSSNCSRSECLTQETQERGSKRQHSYMEAEFCSTNVTGAHYNSLLTYLPIFYPNKYDSNGASSIHFPVTHKRRRTEEGRKLATCRAVSAVAAAENCSTYKMHPVNDAHENLFASESTNGILAAHYDSSGTSIHCGAEDKVQIFNSLQALGDDQRLTKKRLQGPTKSRPCEQLLNPIGEATTPGIVQGETLDQPHRCTEGLVAQIHAKVTTKKQSKRESSIGSSPPYLCNQRQSLKMAPPLTITWKAMSPMDEMIEHFSLLDINAQSRQHEYKEQNVLIAHQMKYTEQNALVLYQRDGTIVPFKDSFESARRRRPRPKVDLDDETNRVWKLLLEDINNEGIDGTDAEKAKWWEEERRVFHGRTDSFIARMHLIQGDRRFSPWKGSVVDSVIGVFLTQNVSDHLSSAAFMSLAARYPPKSEGDHKESREEQTCIPEEQEVHVLDADNIIAWHEEKSNHLTCGQGSNTQQCVEHSTDKEAANDSGFLQSNSCNTKSTDNSIGQLTDCSKDNLNIFQEPGVGGCRKLASSIRDQTEFDDILSSQNSVDSLDAQTEKSELCSHSTFEGETPSETRSELFSWPNSFVELLQTAGTTMLHGVCNQGRGNRSFSIKGSSQSKNDICNSENKDRSYNTEAFTSRITCKTPCSNSTLHVMHNPGEQEVSRSSDTELCATENSDLSAESATQTIFQRTRIVTFEEVPKSLNENENASNNHQIEVKQSTIENPETNFGTQSQLEEGNYKIHQALDSPNVLLSNAEVRARSIMADDPRDPNKKPVRLSLSVSYGNLDSRVDAEKASTSKAKSVRTWKEKQNTVDWDSLRKEAQTNGKKRERTVDTMDSLDWEAVRCANVKEIAETIKERGMNNVLAERIKDFLNRLAREHGSIDLEWLRDVPPDKAKEYLLSIRGLGLKSVECVRLLTLHHLAFPVDINVGRIAVRLGWVPLQPLPESLQLHLLELYPILDSIQKYLWPRLCKLDQRTLYELHYQMITFGKVFCTKSKPNCNACPMRGECRHYASAFASARFALPAPEDKTVSSAAENQPADQNSVGICSSSKLCLPQANEQNSVVNCSSLKLCLPQAKEQLRANSDISSSNPIVEVPATPEPTIEEPATPEPDQTQVLEPDIEDFEDPDEIPTIKLNMEEFTQNLQIFVDKNMELQENEMSNALVTLSAEAASIVAPKLKNKSRLRTEHHVYELPDSHPLLQALDKREPDDPSPYLLAIWTPGETANSIQPLERSCGSQECGRLCGEETCFSCSSLREANSQTIRGTLLIPCRTAMRGSFPLNGTYFQVNEVFADHESSLNPINVPRAWIWNLPRRTVYFGTSTPTIFRGLSTEEIQCCFWRGFVCVRGFEPKTRAPRPLVARFHLPAYKMTKTKGRIDENE